MTYEQLSILVAATLGRYAIGQSGNSDQVDIEQALAKAHAEMKRALGKSCFMQ
jgi:hypothetical protein